MKYTTQVKIKGILKKRKKKKKKEKIHEAKLTRTFY